MRRLNHLRALTPLVAIAALMGGCKQEEISVTSFEGPTDSAILPIGSVFDVTVAFVANSRSGDIAKLDLSRSAYLADSVQAGWLRGTALPTGRNRYLEQVAVYSSDQRLEGGDDTFVTVFASDSARQSLLVVPYLDSAAGEGPGESCLFGDLAHKPSPPKYPICFKYDDTYPVQGEQIPAISLKTGDADATLTQITIEDGYTTTETFYITYDGELERFDVRGTTSGAQPPAYVGVSYVTRNSALAFTIHLDSGALEEGDAFEVETSNGIVEIPVGGVIQDLRFDAHSGLLLGTVEIGPEEGAVFALDAEAARTQGLSAPLTLVPAPLGSRPGRMDLVEDPAGGPSTLYIADPSELGIFHRIDLSAGADGLEAGWTWQEVGFSTVDLALSRAPDVPWLYLGMKEAFGDVEGGVLGAGLVRIFDVNAGVEIDFNPATPYITAEGCLDHCGTLCEERCLGLGYQGEALLSCEATCVSDCGGSCHDEGIPVNGPIEGMAASVGQAELATSDLDGRPERDHLIAVTTYAGSVFTIQASTGCLTFLEGRGSYVLSTEYVDVGSGSNVALWSDLQTGRSGQTSRCGGVTRSEQWIFLYDKLLSAWRVEGSTSGPQVRLAYSDRRYITDGGELSVLIVGGSIPPADGDRFQIIAEDGVASYSELYLPQDLTPYQDTQGLTNQGWYAQQVRQAAVIPQNNLDEVILLNLAPASITNQNAEFAQFQ